MTYSNYIYEYDPTLIEDQRAVVKIEIDGEDWLMDWDEYKKAEAEGRTKPVIFKDKLILVDDETYLELKKLSDWLQASEEK